MLYRIIFATICEPQNLVKFSVELSCGPGKLDEERRTGPACRLSFDECKEKFLSVGKAFEYNEETNHCQEILYNADDTINNYQYWQTCIVFPCDAEAENPCIPAKPSKLLHKF